MLLHLLPLSILSFISLALTAGVQRPLETPPADATSVTLIDALSADPVFEKLLRLVQRARLVPTLNRLNGSTFFAPTNEAIDNHISRRVNSVWRTGLEVEQGDQQDIDNVNEQLRQELFYHLLNFTLVRPDEGKVAACDTLHFPRKPIDPPSPEPPTGPPWMPRPGGTLGGAPQRLRVVNPLDDDLNIGTNYAGKGGTRVVKPATDAGNGLLFAINDVLEVPKDLATIIQEHSQLKYLAKILPPTLIDYFKQGRALTLFLPVDQAWDTVDEIEKLYLESQFAEEDLGYIANMHTISNEKEVKVRWSDSLTDGKTYKSVFGSKLDISNKDGALAVSGAPVVEPDIYASNGVIHLVENLLIPPDALQLTPEKYLLALKCTKFISLIRSVELGHLVDYTSLQTPSTILAVADDVITLGGLDPDLPGRGTEDLKRTLLYHFLPKLYTPKKLKNGMLVETALKEETLNGSPQVLHVEVDPTSKNLEGSDIRFGGVSVVGKQILVGDSTVIYLLTRPLQPPADIMTTALPSLHLSNFLTAIFGSSLDLIMKTRPSTTLLIPRNSAFERLGGLVSKHLFSSSQMSKDDLKMVVGYHLIDGVHYADALIKGSTKSFKTFEGSDLNLHRPDNRSLIFTPSGGWSGMGGKMDSEDVLTQTGVLHELSEVMIPRSVELTNAKLVKAAEGNTMANLVVRAGMGWILNGTAPPEDSEWGKIGDTDGLGWTLLCPTDDAFKGINLTQLWEDSDVLKALVSQHIIPTPRQPDEDDKALKTTVDSDVIYQPLPLNTSTVYSTIQSKASLYGDIQFVPTTDGGGVKFLVRIKDWPESEKRNSSARVLGWGRCTTNGGAGGVVQIDRLLEPWRPTTWAKYGPPVLTGVAGTLVIGLFWWAVSKVWRRDTREATYEPINGFHDEDEVSPSRQ